ncbi:iron siderophore-binding protein [Lentzea sp. NBRC 105346]|uniref:ABC transporter substrate-binding protein n=1 Tax=Lentzea sp. NBRC 105346 TaxID=3032205 RepID=UPI0024A3EDC5|nr:iron-siderophore ABC transporter substrate-binding protein [Lentzea sp. NBRC 105346]GLZ33683.1 iron siderophore-binding protein [Lentzea sp. NBRC 105346]
MRALMLVAVLALAACGTVTDVPTKAAAGFPVTVEHKLGTTEIKAPPKRIVTLGLSDHDAVVALGIQPVGVIDWFKERPWGKWPWLKDKIGTPEIVGERDEYNVEKIASLKPDLILAHYSGIKKEQYDTLSQIAPVVAQVKGFEDYGAPMAEMARLTAKALGKSAEMDKIIDEMNGRFKAVRDKHPEWAGKTAIVADSFQAGNFAVFASHDPKTKFLQDLGFKMPEAIQKEIGKTDVVDFSYERLDVLEADRLVWLLSSPLVVEQLKNEALYKRLNVVKENRALYVPYEDPPVGASISFNTVLSIPYALDHLVPQLEAIK